MYVVDRVSDTMSLVEEELIKIYIKALVFPLSL